jgi:hypothetical protein
MTAVRLSRLGAIGAWAILLLMGCQRAHEVVLFNNTHEKVHIKIDSPFFWRGNRLIDPGRSDRASTSEMLPPGLIVETRNCVLGYVLPPLDDEYFDVGGQEHPTRALQLEPDFTIVLLPLGEQLRLTPNAKSLPLQKKYGFPLRPLFRQCGVYRPSGVFEDG